MLMTPNSRSKSLKKIKSRGEHWKDLPRDPKGRWMKRSSKKKKKNTKSVKSSSPNNITAILDKVKDEFNSFCPRCGGNMKNFRIRCGPEKLVDVNKCILCNFWIPTQDHN